MKLEWFRTHKKFVYWILAPVVILSFAFLFGSGDAINRSRGVKSGPSVRLQIGPTEQYVSPSEVVATRFLLTQYNHDSRTRSSDDAAYHMMAYGTAAAAGFGVGKEEMQERLRQEVKNQIMKRDRSTPPKVDDAMYRLLLEHMKLSPAQFERISQELAVIEKHQRYLYSQARASDEELFIAYLADKETVRMRYKELKSEDFLSKAATPAEDKIKEFYDTHKNNKESVQDLKDVMFSKPKLSADLLFMDTEKTFADMKPTDRELQNVYEQNKASWKLESKAGEPDKFKPFADVKKEVEAKWREVETKKYYERYKRIYWKIEAKPDEKAPTAGEEKFKPFEEVKAEAEKKWHGEWLAEQQRARMDTFKTELTQAERLYEKEQEAKKPEERKPFDLAAWAKTKELKHWKTDELLEDEFRKGKPEVGTKDVSLAASLFELYRETGTPFLDNEHKRQQKLFGVSQIVEQGGKGLVSARVHEYKAEVALPLDQAKAGIIAHLKVLESVELAEKEAKKMKEDWAAGTKVPPVDSLQEVRGDRDDKSPILRAYFRSPKAIGEPIDVAPAPADDSPQSTNPNMRFYVAFPVERELPTRKTFHDDTIWPRDRKRAEIEQSNFYAVYGNLSRQLQKAGKVIGDVNEDPPLFDEYRKGRQTEE